jgi:hypothetical protein
LTNVRCPFELLVIQHSNQHIYCNFLHRDPHVDNFLVEDEHKRYSEWVGGPKALFIFFYKSQRRLRSPCDAERKTGIIG